jgi:hypothetical protein
MNERIDIDGVGGLRGNTHKFLILQNWELTLQSLIIFD